MMITVKRLRRLLRKVFRKASFPKRNILRSPCFIVFIQRNPLDHPVLDRDYFIKMLQQGEVMGCHDKRSAQFFALPLHQGHDLAGIMAVEVSRGFVGQDKLGEMGQGPGDRHPLLLAPRELAGVPFLQLRDAYFRKKPVQVLNIPLPFFPFRVPERQLRVLKSRERRDEVEKLEYIPDQALPDPDEFPFRKGGYLAVIKIYPAGGGLVNTPQDIEERCLAGTGRADNRAKLPLVNLNGYPA